MLGNFIRTFIIVLAVDTKWANRIMERIIFTEIGITGYLATHDNKIAKDRRLKKLNRFEKWIFKSLIERERTRRRNAFAEAFTAVTGEEF